MCRFFRFTIRDWFWLVLVLSVGLAWLVRERQLQVEPHHLIIVDPSNSMDDSSVNPYTLPGATSDQSN
jgi:hypothetical protein